MNNLIVLGNWEKAKQAIIECKSIDELKQIRDKAEALRAYAKQAKESLEVQNNIAEIKSRCERKMGEFSKELPVNIGKFNQHSASSHDGTKQNILKQAGIKHYERYEAIANLPEDVFEEHIRSVKESNVELTTIGLIKVARDYQKIKKRTTLAEAGALKEINIDLRFGDFEEVFLDIEDGSVDCIITDPPYPYEFIECWSKLSKFAKRVLKPNGFCIAYSGQMNLPEVLKRMSENLDYYWTFAVYHEGQTQIVNGVNLICRWKPVLIFQNGKKKLSNTFQDYFISSQREKEGHDWQQSKSGVAYLIEMFTEKGDLIIDPFTGSGTTLIVASEKGRDVKGAEIDETTYNIAKMNL